MARRCFLPWTARLTLAMGKLLLVGGGRGRGSGCRSATEELAGLHLVGAADLGLAVEATGHLRRLLLEDVVHAGLAPHDLAGAGHLEALGGASVRLHLGHRYWFSSPANGAVG